MKNKLQFQLQTNRTISTLYKCNIIPSISIQYNHKFNSLINRNYNRSLLTHTIYRFMSQTREDTEDTDDKINEEQEQQTETTQETEQEDVESGEESEHDQSEEV